MENDKRQAVDHRLDQLGAVPGDVAQLIERYAGSARLGALQADALLNTLGVVSPSSLPPPPLRQAPEPLPRFQPAPAPVVMAPVPKQPEPAPEVEPAREPEEQPEEESRVVSLSDAAPAFDPDFETDGPPMQRMDARLARQVSTRKNTPFPGGIAGADEMPAFAPRRGGTPRPFSIPAPLGARPALPSLIPPLGAARPPEPPPSPESQALAGLGRDEPPSASVELPKPAPEDDFEIIVDDEIVEIEPDEVEAD